MDNESERVWLTTLSRQSCALKPLCAKLAKRSLQRMVSPLRGYRNTGSGPPPIYSAILNAGDSLSTS